MRNPERKKKRVNKQSQASLDNLKPQFEVGNNASEKPFDKKMFETLCIVHCTEAEICDMLGYKSHETLNDKLRAEYGGTFEEVYPRFMNFGKASLRRVRWGKAMAGDNAMITWLSKQILGESDKQEIKTEQDHKIEIQRTVVTRAIEPNQNVRDKTE